MSRGVRASSWAPVPAYLALTLLLTWPLARDAGRRIPAVYGGLDPLLQSFLLGWSWKTLPTSPGSLFNLPIFHPHVRALTFMDHMIGEAILAWPAYLVTGRLAPPYNLLVVLSFVLSGWCMQRLMRASGCSRGASFLAGVIFAFGPYRLSNLGSLNQLQGWFIPLALLALVRWYRRRGVGELAIFLAVVVGQAWFGWYGAFHLLVAATVFGLYEALRVGVTPNRTPAKSGFLLAALAIAAILPGLVPYVVEAREMPAFRRTLGMTALWSADLVDYVRLNVESVWGSIWPGGRGAQGYWPGFLGVALAAVGAIAMLRRPPAVPAHSAAPPSTWLTLRAAHSLRERLRRRARGWGEAGAFLVVGATGFILSLGPVLQVAGHRTAIPLPFGVAFFIVPGFSSMRVPGRFAVLVLLATAALAAYGYDRLAVRRRAMLFVVMLAAGVAGALIVPPPMVEPPAPDRVPPVYAWLAAHDDGAPLLELPVPMHVTEENATYALRQAWLLVHNHPRLDGVSGFVPPDVEQKRLILQGFPSEGALRTARGDGARWIVIHYADFAGVRGDSLRARVARTTDLAEAARFGDDVVYRLEGGGSASQSRR